MSDGKRNQQRGRRGSTASIRSSGPTQRPSLGTPPRNGGDIRRGIEALRERLRQIRSSGTSGGQRSNSRPQAIRQEGKANARPRTAPRRTLTQGDLNLVHQKIKQLQALPKGTRPVFRAPKPRNALPKFRPTGVKGKGLAAQRYAMLQSKVRDSSHGGSKSFVNHYALRGHKKYTSESGRTSYVGHDLVGQFNILDTAMEADEVLHLNINPLELSFPALKIETQLDQQYKCTSFSIHFACQVSDNVNGSLLGYWNPDPDEVIPSDIDGLQIGIYKGGVPQAMKRSMTFEMPAMKRPLLYCRDNGSDDRLVNQCQFKCQVVTPPSIQTDVIATQIQAPIEVWCSYHFEFFARDLQPLDNDTQAYLVSYEETMSLYNNYMASATFGVGTKAFELDVFGICNSIADTGNNTPPRSLLAEDSKVGWVDAHSNAMGLFVSFDPVNNWSMIGLLQGYGNDFVDHAYIEYRVRPETVGTDALPILDVAGGFGNFNCNALQFNGPYSAGGGGSTTNVLLNSIHLEIPVPGRTTNIPLSKYTWVCNAQDQWNLLEPGTYNVVWVMNGFKQTATPVAYPSLNGTQLMVQLQQQIVASPTRFAGPATLEYYAIQAYDQLSNEERCQTTIRDIIRQYKLDRMPDRKAVFDVTDLKKEISEGVLANFIQRKREADRKRKEASMAPKLHETSTGFALRGPNNILLHVDKDPCDSKDAVELKPILRKEEDEDYVLPGKPKKLSIDPGTPASTTAKRPSRK